MGVEAKEWIIATWALVVFTGILAGATIAYAISTYKLYKGSQEQAEAIRELTKAMLQLPAIEEHIQTQKELAEEREKVRIKYKRKALTGQGGE